LPTRCCHEDAYRIHDCNSMMLIKAIKPRAECLRLYRFGVRCYIILECFFREPHGFRLRCGRRSRPPRSSSKPRANRRSIAAKTACWPAGVLRPTSSKNACKSIDFCPSSSKIRRTRRSVSFTIVFNGENRGRVRHPLRLCQKPMILCEYSCLRGFSALEFGCCGVEYYITNLKDHPEPTGGLHG
jgi:hypothetical protein